MKLILLILLSSIFLFAAPKAELFALYQSGKYLQGCNQGYKNLATQNKDESYISLYAFSCLQADELDRLISAILLLNQSSESRANASYFSLLLMQKQLLAQALYDQKSLTNLKFPTSSHLISKVFGMFIKNPQEGILVKEYTDSSNPRQSYKLYPADKNGKKTIAIDEYYDKILVSHHIY